MSLASPLPDVLAPSRPANSAAEHARLARAWLALAVGALATSGVLSLGVVAARIPALARYWTHTELAHRVLVVHVDLAVLVWFCSFPMVLLRCWAAATGRDAPAGVARFAPWVASVGAAMLLGGLLPGVGTPHTVNYAPMVAHWGYATGLLLFFGAVAVSHLDPGLWRPGSSALLPSAGARDLPPGSIATLLRATPLVRVGSAAVLMALLAALIAAARSSRILEMETLLETVMWGPGHLLQIANVAFAILAWALLAVLAWARPVEGRWLWIGVATSLALPLVAAALILVWRDPSSWLYRQGFTTLMRWGLFPAVAVALPLGLGVAGRFRTASRCDRSAAAALVASTLLMLVGFAFGAAIRGSDLRIPGHYHACIGAVTLAYMALSLLLPGLEAGAPPAAAALAERGRRVRLIATLYGSGQLIFASGLMWAGSFGLGRKTYGVDQQLDRDGQQLGLLVMAIGGALALAGGGVWAVAAVARLRRLHASAFLGENLARIGFASAPESNHPAELPAMHPTRNRT